MESGHVFRKATSNVVYCPFNTAHTMPQKTLIMHLAKCPDKRPNQTVRCSFNNLHVVEALNLAVHEAGCPDRLNFDQIVYQTTKTKRDVKLKVPEIIDDVDETWADASTNQQRSNKTIPVQNVIKTINEKPCFMRPPAGCTKSERKKYRSEAHKAYRDVDLSYKPNSSINDRIDDSKKKSGNINVQQGKNNGLFFGKRP